MEVVLHIPHQRQKQAEWKRILPAGNQGLCLKTSLEGSPAPTTLRAPISGEPPPVLPPTVPLLSALPPESAPPHSGTTSSTLRARTGLPSWVGLWDLGDTAGHTCVHTCSRLSLYRLSRLLKVHWAACLGHTCLQCPCLPLETAITSSVQRLHTASAQQ